MPEKYAGVDRDVLFRIADGPAEMKTEDKTTDKPAPAKGEEESEARLVRELSKTPVSHIEETVEQIRKSVEDITSRVSDEQFVQGAWDDFILLLTGKKGESVLKQLPEHLKKLYLTLFAEAKARKLSPWEIWRHGAKSGASRQFRYLIQHLAYMILKNSQKQPAIARIVEDHGIGPSAVPEVIKIIRHHFATESLIARSIASRLQQ